MENIIQKLKDITDKFSEISEIASKGGDYARNELYKNVEDGILDNLHTASKEQLNLLLNRYKFVYYHHLNNKENLKSEINKRLRDNALNKLLN